MPHDYIQIVKQIFLKHIDTNKYKLFLFGSRAGQNNFANSDIDVGIQGKQKLPADVLLNIEKEIENSVVPYKIDIVDFYFTSEQFRKEAKKNMVLWN